MSLNNAGFGLLVDVVTKGQQSLRGIATQLTSIEKGGMAVNTRFTQLQATMQGFQQIQQAGQSIMRAGMKGFQTVFTPAVAAAEEFQAEMATLGVIVGGSQVQMEKLRDVAIETGIATIFSSTEAVKGFQKLKAAGLSLNETIGALPSTLDLVAAAQGKLTLAEGATAAAVAMKKFNLDIKGAAKFTDQFVRATQESNFQMGDLLGFLDSMGSAPMILKMTTAESLAMGSAMRNVGVSSRMAGHAIEGFGRQMIMAERSMDRYQQRLAKAAAQGQTYSRLKPAIVQAMEAFDVAFFDTKGKFRGVEKVMVDLVRASKNFSTEQEFMVKVQSLLGTQAKNVLMSVMAMKTELADGSILTGADAFQQYIKMYKGASGEARTAAQSFLDTWRGIKVMWQGTADTFMIVLGTPMLSILGKGLKLFTGLVNKMLVFLKNNQAIALGIMVIIGAVSGLLVVLGLVLIALGAIGAAIIAIQIILIPAAAAVVGAFTAALPFIWPVLIVLAAVAAVIGVVIAALVLLKKAWKSNFLGIGTILDHMMEVVRFWRDVWSDPAGATKRFTESLIKAMVAVLMFVPKLVGFLLKGIVKAVIGAVVLLFKGIKLLLYDLPIFLVKLLIGIIWGIVSVIGKAIKAYFWDMPMYFHKLGIIMRQKMLANLKKYLKQVFWDAPLAILDSIDYVLRRLPRKILAGFALILLKGQAYIVRLTEKLNKLGDWISTELPKQIDAWLAGGGEKSTVGKMMNIVLAILRQTPKLLWALGQAAFYAFIVAPLKALPQVGASLLKKFFLSLPNLISFPLRMIGRMLSNMFFEAPMALFRGLQTILGSLLSILWDGLSGLFYDLPLMLLRGFASVASALASSIESIMPSWLRKGVTWAAGSDSGDTSETTPGSPSPAFAGAPSRARTSIEASFAPTPTAAAEPGQSLTAVLIGLQQAISRLASRGGQAIQVQLLLDGEVLHDQLVALSDQNAESNYLAAPGGA